MTNPNENVSVSQQIEAIEQEIKELRAEQKAMRDKVKQLIQEECPAQGLLFHDEIFRLQQDKLRMDTEIQFREVALRRLKSTW